MTKKEKNISLTLTNLWNTIDERKNSDPNISYTALLFKKGAKRVAQKMGEEAVETVIASLGKNKKEIAEESADLIYHLMVLWNICGISPEDVYKVLDNRKT